MTLTEPEQSPIDRTQSCLAYLGSFVLNISTSTVFFLISSYAASHVDLSQHQTFHSFRNKLRLCKSRADRETQLCFSQRTTGSRPGQGPEQNSDTFAASKCANLHVCTHRATPLLICVCRNVHLNASHWALSQMDVYYRTDTAKMSAVSCLQRT